MKTTIHQDYQSTMKVGSTAQAAFAALTAGIAHWWSNAFSGAGTQAGDRFTVRFWGDNFYTLEVVEVVPFQRVIWQCVDGCTDAAGIEDKQEWIGTRIVWSITTDQGQTAISLLHEGLNEEMECIEACTIGWNYFFHDSLVPFLEQGKGRPYPEAFLPM